MNTALRLTTTFLGAVGLLLGCSAADPEPTGSTAEALSYSCPTQTALFELPAWIPSCPAVPGWSASAVFPGASGSLARFCRYTTTSTSPNFNTLTSTLQVLTNSSNVAEPDCPVVAPLGFAEHPAIWKPLRKNYLTQASYVPDLPPGKSHVRVAVLDSAAKTFSSLQTDTFGHGRAVGRVINELSCSPGGFCASEMWNVLAMPHKTPTDIDQESGGYFGTRGELATAIYKAVDDWVYDFNKSPKTVPPRLILNLSLGWVPEYGGTDPGKMPLPAEAVYEALQHAACYGVLAIAAAGNDSGDGSKGPMLPGGWEQFPAPTKCKGYKLPTKFPLTSGYPAPLVYAASAVDATDRPLANTRVSGQARLVAYGDSVVTTDTRGSGITDNLTGSSMSAAVVSGAAAAAWAYRPEWTRDQLMSAVTDSAVELVPGDPTGHRVVDFVWTARLAPRSRSRGSRCATRSPRRTARTAAARSPSAKRRLLTPACRRPSRTHPASTPCPAPALARRALSAQATARAARRGRRPCSPRGSRRSPSRVVTSARSSSAGNCTWISRTRATRTSRPSRC